MSDAAEQWEGRSTESRRPRWPLLAVFVVVLLGAGILARGGASDAPEPLVIDTAPPDESEHREPDDGAEMTATGLGTWRRLPVPPVTLASSPVAVWTGAEVLVWAAGSGGSGVLLRFDPEGDHWRSAADPPIAARSQAVVAWTGRGAGDAGGELIVWGGAGPGGAALADGAAYNPSADRWRMLPDPPPGLGPRAGAAAAWTGTEVVVAGGVGDRVRLDTVGSYDPAADTWRLRSGLPDNGRIVDFAWTGAVPSGDGVGLAVLLASGDALQMQRYDPDVDRWGTPEQLPLSPTGQRSLSWTERALVAWGGRSPGLPGLVWQGPMRHRFLHAQRQPPRELHAAVWTGEHLVIWGGYDGSGFLGDGVALDPELGRWHPLALAPLSPRTRPAAVWTGEELFVVGGLDRRGVASDAAAWQPGR